MSQEPITLDVAITEMNLIAIGYQDWLNRFSEGPKKRPDTEIQRYNTKLAIVLWVLEAMKRKVGQ